ncbi:putative restriction endonuclease [Streptomyces sp. KS 21]|nr:putative restriction endonuclease [Streptomyces sp. KS 21]
MMAGRDVVRNLLVMFVQRQIPVGRRYPLQTQDVDIPAESSEPQPDLVVLPAEAAPESGRLLPARTLAMVVEVVSKTSKLRDYMTKRSIYAAGGIPTSVSRYHSRPSASRSTPRSSTPCPSSGQGTVTKSISSSTRPSRTGSRSL